MKNFLFLFRGGEMSQDSPEKWQEHMQKWIKWMEDLSNNGKLIGAEPLGQSGKTVKGTKKVVSDGPFMEGKEMVGGYLLCRAGDYDEAIVISKECPIFEFEDGSVEVREIQEIKM